jgi:hypothetical protein
MPPPSDDDIFNFMSVEFSRTNRFVFDELTLPPDVHYIGLAFRAARGLTRGDSLLEQCLRK